MCACLRSVSHSVSSDDVIIFFTDGGSTDGNPTSIATSIKNAGVRFISIGCGSQADSGLLMSMASSKTDYHHARSASGIIKAFQAVAKSLGQQHIALSTVGKKSDSNIIARQVQARGNATPSSLTGTTSGPTELADNEGFEFIEGFKCHHCSSIERIACANCGKNTCSGGASHSKTENSKINCPFCNEYSEIEITKKGVLGRIGRNGGKGKKGV